MSRVNFHEALPALPVKEPHKPHRSSSIERVDVSSSFRLIRELEAQNQLLKGKVIEAETKYENLCAFMQSIVSKNDTATRSLRLQNEALIEQSNGLKAKLEDLQRVLRLHNLQGEVNRPPTKPVTPKPRDLLFQSPKKPSVLQSPVARVYGKN